MNEIYDIINLQSSFSEKELKSYTTEVNNEDKIMSLAFILAHNLQLSISDIKNINSSDFLKSFYSNYDNKISYEDNYKNTARNVSKDNLKKLVIKKPLIYVEEEKHINLFPKDFEADFQVEYNLINHSSKEHIFFIIDFDEKNIKKILKTFPDNEIIHYISNYIAKKPSKNRDIELLTPTFYSIKDVCEYISKPEKINLRFSLPNKNNMYLGRLRYHLRGSKQVDRNIDLCFELKDKFDIINSLESEKEFFFIYTSWNKLIPYDSSKNKQTLKKAEDLLRGTAISYDRNVSYSAELFSSLEKYPKTSDKMAIRLFDFVNEKVIMPVYNEQKLTSVILFEDITDVKMLQDLHEITQNTTIMSKVGGTDWDRKDHIYDILINSYNDKNDLNRSYYNWVILNSYNNVVGYIGLKKYGDSKYNDVEFRIFINEQKSGHGKRALLQIIYFYKDIYSSSRIYSVVDKSNKASIQLSLSVGMKEYDSKILHGKQHVIFRI